MNASQSVTWTDSTLVHWENKKRDKEINTSFRGQNITMFPSVLNMDLTEPKSGINMVAPAKSAEAAFDNSINGSAKGRVGENVAFRCFDWLNWANQFMLIHSGIPPPSRNTRLYRAVLWNAFTNVCIHRPRRLVQ